jgi:hypothetical protein
MNLQQFASSGGKVIFAGKLPELATEKNFRDAIKPGDLSWARQETSGKITEEILSYLPVPDVKIDKFCPEFKYIHRKLNDGELYFFFNEGKEKQSLKITLAGETKPQVWDALTGEIFDIKDVVGGKKILTIPLSFEPWETKFLITGK